MSTEYKKRTRSPSYPILDLESAIEKAKEFFEAEGSNLVPAGVVPICWGLKENSSVGNRYISALLQYGIFDDEGTGTERKIFLTDLGKRIVLDERENSVELQQAIKEAALEPHIHKELWEKWGPEIPSNANMKFHLVKGLSFNQKKVDKFINIYRNTIDYANLKQLQSDNEPLLNDTPSTGAEKKATSEVADFEDISTEIKNSSRFTGDGGQVTQFDIVIPLISGDHATLKIPRSLSNDDFNLLKTLIITYLDASKPALTKELKKEDGGTD